MLLFRNNPGSAFHQIIKAIITIIIRYSLQWLEVTDTVHYKIIMIN